MNVNKASLFVKKGWLYDKCHGGQVNNIKAVFAFQKLLYCNACNAKNSFMETVNCQLYRLGLMT